MGVGKFVGITTVEKRGRVTIPKEIRRALKLREGKRLHVEVEGDRIVMRPTVDWETWNREMIGCIKTPLTDPELDPLKAKRIWKM